MTRSSPPPPQPSPPRRPGVWVDGHIIPWEDAQISVLAHSVQRGAAVFDVGALRPAARAGTGSLLFRPRAPVRPEALRIDIPRDARKAGPEVFPPQAKVGASYLGPMLAKQRAVARGFDEVVLLDREGRVAEAPTANVFAVKDGALLTPPIRHVLAGITRDSILALARAEGVDAREADLTPDDLAGADEAFLAATSLPVHPIASVDGRPLRSAAGPVTTRFREMLLACERGQDARFARWVVAV